MKKILSLVLILAMCVSAVPLASAANNASYEESLAQDLKALGLFQGVSDTEFDLNRAPTRVEALVMLIRLLGKDAEALGGQWVHPFSDVPGWANKYVGYAYENGLTNGISETEFGTGTATIQMYLTFVLRSLDYTDKNGEDFSYSEPYSLAYHAGILPNSVDRENFLRADVVIISYCALSAYMKNTQSTLAAKLITEGVFTQGEFDEIYDKTAIKYDGATKTELSAEEIYKKCSPAVFYIEVYDAYGQAFATGSGFFIDSEGTAVTNYHVIDGAYSAKIKIGDTDEFYDVEGIYDWNESEDWAVIKVAGSGVDYLTIADYSTVIGGATVYAIGSPLGLQNTISQGIISNANRVLEDISFVQTSAAISNGSSGGALINKYGEVIGLALPMSIIEGYSSESVTDMASLRGGSEPTPSHSEYAADDVLRAYVIAFKNEELSESIAYTENIETENGYCEISIVLNYDYSLEVLIWEVYKGDMYYFSLELTGDERFLYYDYESEDGDMRLIGSSWIDPASVTRGMQVKFDDVEGNIKAHTEEAIAAEYLEMGLDFVNEIYDEIAHLESFDHYTVKDLGFINFE